MEPELHPQHKTLLITAIVFVLLIVIAVLIYVFTSFTRVVTPMPTEETSPEVAIPSEEDFEFSEFPDTSVNVTPPEEVTNPVENLPASNPFEAKTNPFEDTYKNPFE